MRTILLLFMLIISSDLLSQGVNTPLDNNYYHLLERMEVRSGKFSPSFHASVKPYNRKEIGQFLDSLDKQELNKRDQFNLNYLKNDNWEWVDSSNHLNRKGFLGHIYKTKVDFFNVHEEEFDLHVNPILGLSYGNESLADQALFQNTRGVEVRGLINKKLGFYTYITENQVLNPAHVRDFRQQFSAVPGIGFWKPFGEERTAVDYFQARGHISFQATKNINLQFGHDRFNIGNGERSLILSDFAPSYLFLKAETTIWKFNYTNLFGLQTADVVLRGSQLSGTQFQYPRKFMSFHHLSYNISKNFNIGVFEAIMSGDSSVATNPIDPVYFNPIIFYRALEQQDGSSGNALLGMDFRWIFLKRFSLYGQFVLDEFLLDNLREGGWWANKWAVQTGLKYFNAFEISNLDLQAEYNVARPFIYAHDGVFTNYAHYKQPLAHPLGANFEEFVGSLRYQFSPRLHLDASFVYATFGTDSIANVNFGGDIFKENNSRVRFTNPETGNPYDFGHTIGQGEGNSLQFIRVNLRYMLFHNFFIEATYANRSQQSAFNNNMSENEFYQLGIRMNLTGNKQLF